MNLNRICPDCATEYLPHVEKCADCGAVLLLHEEYGKALAERERRRELVVDKVVAVREGDLKWMRELESVLARSGIPCAVISDPSCGKSCRGTYSIVVPPEDAGRAQDRIEEYFMELHPELRTSRELQNEGRCPACSSPVGAHDRVCADCGLTLIIEEEE